MKTNDFLLLTAILFVAMSCSNDDKLDDEQLNQGNKIQFTDTELKVLYQMRGENNKVSLEEATLLANDAIYFLDGNVPVKSGAGRQIASIMPLSFDKNAKNTLRSLSENQTIDIPDTLAYVFNFADSAGFTIIAADTRVEVPILAIVYSGTLGKETDKPGIGIFLEGAENYIMQSIIDAEQRKDSLMNDICEKLAYGENNESRTKALAPQEIIILSSVLIDAGPWTATYTKGPLVPVEWGQGDSIDEPFWRNVKNKKSCGTCPAGCVAVATAHIMSYWQYPTGINGKSFNWSELNQYTGFYSNGHNHYRTWTNYVGHNQTPPGAKTQIANLMEEIGREVDMDYDCDGSGADSDDAIDYLKGIGYTGGTKMNYDYNSVVSSLYNNKPVYATGYRTDNTFLGIHIYYSDGHAWVIDGYVNRRRSVTLQVTYSGTPPITPPTKASNATYTEIVYAYEYAHYLHNNWGWSGNCNGWFVEGCFNSHGTKLTDPNQSGSLAISSDYTRNYQYNNKIYVNLSY